MTQSPSAQSRLFTVEEGRQLQQEDEAPEEQPSSEPRLWHGSAKRGPSYETLLQDVSTPTARMQNEELADLLAEALQGHRVVLEVLASMQERLMGEATAVRTALDRVTNLVINLEYDEEEYDDAGEPTGIPRGA